MSVPVGRVLTVTNPGTWTETPTSYAYQWQRDNAGGGTFSGIAGATASTYTTQAADNLCQVRCVVSARNYTAQSAAGAMSNAIQVIALPVNTAPPAVTGTTEVGQALVCSTGTWTGSPTYAYQWQRDNAGGGSFTNIAGATTNVYALDPADQTCMVRCNVIATNAGGSVTATSNAVGPVTPAPQPASGGSALSLSSVTDARQPHFALPFRFSPPAAVTEQDSLEEIADCCVAILLCPYQFRVELPEFGLPDPTFSMPTVDLNVIRTVVDRWEPRAAMTLDTEPDASDTLLARVQAVIQMRTES